MLFNTEPTEPEPDTTGLVITAGAADTIVVSVEVADEFPELLDAVTEQ